MGSAKAAVLPVPVWAMPKQIAALHELGNGAGLDGGWLVVTFSGNRFEKRGREVEF